MAFDPYSPCPCGSGKKFKWCCQPIHVQIDRAFQQAADGQHEAAMRIMEEVTTSHPANPEAWGRKAQLLYQHDRLDDAEQALQKAFDINPNYPFGHLLRGVFRQDEGEISGALLLFRKAADLYDPDARDVLGQVYSLVADAEMKLNRPVAAHAALKISLRLMPSEELRQGMEQLFGAGSRLPEAARRDYSFQSPAADGAGRRAAWDRALASAGTGKLSDAARAFEQLTTENSDDPAAWFDLGLVRAWLGDNAASLEALDRYVTLEPDEERAATAWALAEVLRFGQGMEDQADWVEHSALYQIRQPEPLLQFLQRGQEQGQLVSVQVVKEQGLLTGIVLDTGPLLTAGPTRYPKLGAYLMIVGDLVRLWTTNPDGLDRAARALEEGAGPGLSEGRRIRGPASFADVLTEALVFPERAADEAAANQAVLEHVQRFFEETWIHRPLRSLGGVPPVDAAGHPVLLKKLRGLVQFMEQCTVGKVKPYDFDRLRRKLGLLEQQPSEAATARAEAGPDIEAMGPAELAALAVETLTDQQLDQAFRTAQKLDTREMAGRFARTLLERPPRPEQPDRYPLYNYLIQTSLAQGDADAALAYVDDGERADCEQNEGRRRNDYELRRGQVLTKRGDPDAARDVFERLIQRDPSELRYRGTAAESMLALKQPSSAASFAEAGLAKAREQNDRDSEQYFQELVSAARTQAG
jgi:tetratricopeptide (TPR) repeat protein